MSASVAWHAFTASQFFIHAAQCVYHAMFNEGCSFTEVRRSVYQKVRFTDTIHIASEYSPRSLHTQLQSPAARRLKSFWCQRETLHGTLNLQCLPGPGSGNISAQPSFLWWRGTTESLTETSWDWWRDGPEPGWFGRSWRLPWPFGTGAITMEKCLTSDPFILSRPVDQLQYSILQWVCRLPW